MIDGGQIDFLRHLVGNYGYGVLFPLAILEGPIIMLTAGFMASLHIFKFSMALIMITLGGIFGDLICYFAGRFGFSYLYTFFKKAFRLSPNRIQKLEAHIRKNAGKMFILAKISPPLHIPILILAGVIKSPFEYFFYFNLLATFIKSILLMMIGFYFGKTFLHASRALDVSVGLFLVISVLLVAAYIKVTKASSEKIKEEEKLD